MTEKSEFWSCLLENGGSYYRVDRTFASRREIVDLLAGKGTHDWERNFADSKLKLGETSSGQWQNELAREQQKWERERRELREEMVEALRKSDRDAEEALRKERERSSIKVKRAEEHHQAMQSILEDRLDRCKEDVARLKAEMEQLETSHQQRIGHNTKQQANLKEQNVDLQEKIFGLSIQEEQAPLASFHDEQQSTPRVETSTKVTRISQKSSMKKMGFRTSIGVTLASTETSSPNGKMVRS
ncbi:hypothetical protein KJ359_004904 [Pestalotiopsis sp. 9143b]|nr:hypothetical protein KJ359_004904 [Pestalotiopsis sp. 9143b]